MCTYPLSNYVSSHQFSPTYTTFLAAINNHTKPSRLSEALTHPHCRVAMQCEIDARECNHTWTLTSLPPSKKPLGCKWVFKIKRKFDRNIEWYKVCLVILGKTQVEGLDYHEPLLQLPKWSPSVPS